jgi:hypothetical protein
VTVATSQALPRVTQGARRAPRGLRVSIARLRPRRGTYRFRVGGQLRLPTGLAARPACATRGRVLVEVRYRRRVVATRRLTVSSTCRFSSVVAVRRALVVVPATSTARRPALAFRLRFLGNAALLPKSEKSVTRRVG